jgi:hypothetical protein
MVAVLEPKAGQNRLWGQLVARAWQDDGFRRRLLAEPAAVLSEEGFELPEGLAVRVVEGTAPEASDDDACFWLPAPPPQDDLIEDDFSSSHGTCRARTYCYSGGQCGLWTTGV